MKSPSISRRRFLQSASLAAIAAGFPALRGAAQEPALKNRIVPDKDLRVAIIGCGGQGRWVVRNRFSGLEGLKITAFCDVESGSNVDLFYKEFPDIPAYKDYRKLLTEHGDGFDAVYIATPDHMHYPVAMLAMDCGKHVFVEKPMAHTIGEARAMKAKAQETGLVTQMGNFGHANEGTRLTCEWIRAGAIGAVREIHAWTNRPIWPQGVLYGPAEPVPETLDWNLWLGVSEYVGYNSKYAPFKWRGYWNWGCGAIGDMACHTLDAPFWALDLRGDCRVTAETRGMTKDSAPKGARVTYEYPERNGRPALKLVWYEGNWSAPVPKELGPEGQLNAEGGSLYYGDNGILYNSNVYNTSPRLIPQEKMTEFKKHLPAKTIPRVPGGNAYLEWLNACKGGTLPGSNFIDHAADLTEMALLGNLAMRAGKPIEWDSQNACVKGMPELEHFIHKQYRNF